MRQWKMLNTPLNWMTGEVLQLLKQELLVPEKRSIWFLKFEWRKYLFVQLWNKIFVFSFFSCFDDSREKRNFVSARKSRVSVPALSQDFARRVQRVLSCSWSFKVPLRDVCLTVFRLNASVVGVIPRSLQSMFSNRNGSEWDERAANSDVNGLGGRQISLGSMEKCKWVRDSIQKLSDW